MPPGEQSQKRGVRAGREDQVAHTVLRWPILQHVATVWSWICRREGQQLPEAQRESGTKVQELVTFSSHAQHITKKIRLTSVQLCANLTVADTSCSVTAAARGQLRLREACIRLWSMSRP